MLDKMKSKTLFYCALFSLMFIFAACSSSNEDCSEMDSTYVKYGYDSSSGECRIIQTIQQNVCGNGIAEQGETFCNCPQDVPRSHPLYGCSGSVGDYLENTCNSQQQCVLEQNDKVVSQTRKVEFRNSDVTFEALLSIDSPYITNIDNVNPVQVNLEFFRSATNSNIRDVEVRRLDVETTNSILLASVEYGDQVTVGQSLQTKYFEFAPTISYSTRQSIRARLVISYTKDFLDSRGSVTRSEDRVETLTASIGTWEIINPSFIN